MPPWENNQPTSNTPNQPPTDLSSVPSKIPQPPTSKTTTKFPTNARTFFFTHWKAIVFILLIIGIFILIFSLIPQKKSPLGLQPNIPETQKKAPVQIVTQSTKDQAKTTAQNILSVLGVLSADPFNLDSSTQSSLANVSQQISNSSTTVIFGGKTFSSLELYEDATAIYFKPVGAGNMATSNLVKVIDKSKVNPDEVLSGLTDTETKIYHLAYNAQTKSISSEKAIQTYLDAQKASGVISSYTYATSTDTIDITYPTDDIPTEIQPIHRAQQAAFVVTAYADPKAYAQKALAEYTANLNQGQVLVSYTDNGTTTSHMIDKTVLTSYLDAFASSSLTVDQKIQAFSSGVNYIGSDQEYDQTFGASTQANAGFSWLNIASAITPVAHADSSAYVDLYNQSGVIVPPTKNVMVIEAPNYMTGEEFSPGPTNIQNKMNDKNGIFSPFWKNDYNFSYIKQTWNQETIETLAKVFSNPEIPTVFYNTHGGQGILLAEIWDEHDPTYCAQNDQTLKQCKDDLAKIRARIDALKAKYGDGIKTVSMQPELSSEDSDTLSSNQAQIPYDLKDLLSSHKRLMTIRITSAFLKQNLSSKSIFILLACHGGSLADSVDARVFLATAPASETTVGLFASSDLMKLAPYLVRDSSLDTKNITTDINRNYNILTSQVFKQGQIILNSIFDKKPIAEQDKIINGCKADKGTLCTINLYAKSGNSVSIAPEVDEAVSDHITFNAPMDTSVDASQVVSIDASQCHAPQDQLGTLKPSWSGNKMINLPWKDKVYREWTDADLASGKPKAGYALITVHNDKATSQYSDVPLTGNPDACTASGCSQQSAWQKPADVKYNATKPKSDFVMALPCIDESFYQMCPKEAATAPAGNAQVLKIKPQPGDTATKDLPSAIKYNDIDYNKVTNLDDATKQNALEISNGWTMSDGCPVEDKDIKACSAVAFAVEMRKFVLSTPGINDNKDCGTEDVTALPVPADQIGGGDWIYINSSLSPLPNSVENSISQMVKSVEAKWDQRDKQILDTHAQALDELGKHDFTRQEMNAVEEESCNALEQSNQTMVAEKTAQLDKILGDAGYCEHTPPSVQDPSATASGH